MKLLLNLKKWMQIDIKTTQRFQFLLFQNPIKTIISHFKKT